MLLTNMARAMLFNSGMGIPRMPRRIGNVTPMPLANNFEERPVSNCVHGKKNPFRSVPLGRAGYGYGLRLQ